MYYEIEWYSWNECNVIKNYGFLCYKLTLRNRKWEYDNWLGTMKLNA